MERRVLHLARLLARMLPHDGSRVELSSSRATGERLRERLLGAEQVSDLALVVNGLTNREVARELAVSPGTVHRQLASIYVETRCAGRTELAARAQGTTE